MTWGNPPAAVFADAEVRTAAILRARVAELAATRPEAEGVRVSVGLPSDYAPATSAPVLAVSIDGTPSADYPVVSRPTVRVVAYHRNRTNAKALAALALAVLLTYPGDELLGRFAFLTGTQPGRDPDNGGDLAAITVRAQARATVL